MKADNVTTVLILFIGSVFGYGVGISSVTNSNSEPEVVLKGKLQTVIFPKNNANFHQLNFEGQTPYMVIHNHVPTYPGKYQEIVAVRKDDRLELRRNYCPEMEESMK